MDFCIAFSASDWQENYPAKYNATPHYFAYRNSGFWSNYSDSWDGLTRVDQDPQQLPKGYWFICRGRAWQGIPSHLQGDPCSTGRLTVIAPRAKAVAKKKHREKCLLINMM